MESGDGEYNKGTLKSGAGAADWPLAPSPQLSPRDASPLRLQLADIDASWLAPGSDKNSGQRFSTRHPFCEHRPGETTPAQAARPDEPSAAVQAALGSDGRVDGPQSCQVFRHPNTSLCARRHLSSIPAPPVGHASMAPDATRHQSREGGVATIGPHSARQCSSRDRKAGLHCYRGR